MPQEYKDAVNGPPKANGYVFPSSLINNRTSTALTLQTFIPAAVNIEDENTPGTEAYYNKEEAKKDFIRLLRKTEMEPTSQWNDVLPQIIKNPSFRAVKDPVERKQLFESYLQTLHKEVEEKEKDRRHRVREGFLQMCRRHPEIKHYTRYKTARPILQEETDFKAAKDEDERRDLFEEFRVEALQTLEAKEDDARKEARKAFRSLLEGLELEPYARWRPTKELFDRKIQEEGRQDEFSAMLEIDYLNVFEDYVKELERDYNEVRQAEKDKKYRAERKNREAFNVYNLSRCN
jgi:pre-mRNA-processing factor 40